MKRLGCLLLVVVALTMWSVSDAGAVTIPGQTVCTSDSEALPSDTQPSDDEPIGLTGADDDGGEGDGEIIGGNKIREDLLGLLGTGSTGDDISDKIWKLLEMFRMLMVLGDL